MRRTSGALGADMKLDVKRLGVNTACNGVEINFHSDWRLCRCQIHLSLLIIMNLAQAGQHGLANCKYTSFVEPKFALL